MACVVRRATVPIITITMRPGMSMWSLIMTVTGRDADVHPSTSASSTIPYCALLSYTEDGAVSFFCTETPGLTLYAAYETGASLSSSQSTQGATELLFGRCEKHQYWHQHKHQHRHQQHDAQLQHELNHTCTGTIHPVAADRWDDDSSPANHDVDFECRRHARPVKEHEEFYGLGSGGDSNKFLMKRGSDL